MKRYISLFLVLVLLSGLLSGCGAVRPELDGILDRLSSAVDGIQPEAGEDSHEQSGSDRPEGEEPRPTPELGPAVTERYFADVWRDEVDFSRMDFELYDIERFAEYTGPIYDLAHEGGSAEEFSDADYWMTAELYYVYTMYQLADLAWCRDPGDEGLIQLSEEAYDVYLQASDEYFKALKAMALSEHSGLMEELYHRSYLEYFASYDTEAQEQQNELGRRESRLVNDYYALMSAPRVDYEAALDVFVELVEVRNSIARGAGYENYCDYAYENIFYRDYGPGDVRDIWEGVKEHFAPLIGKYQEKVWDASDRLIYSRLDTSPEAVLAALELVLPRLAPELKEAFDYMLEHELYDISHDPLKAELGFTTTLYYYNQPYIFNAAYDEFYDYMDMIHEFGHFANFYGNSSDMIYGMSDMDLSELQSQGLEMLFTRYYGEIFGDLAEDAEAYTLMSMIYSVVDGAMYDEFLQRVYSLEDPDGEAVLDIYRELYEQYGYSPYYGYEYEWVDVVHNFEYPFYYISYGVSALGALQIYDMMQSDWPGAVDCYMRACAMDTEYYYFSEAMEELGMDGIFSAENFGGIAESLERALN